MSNGFMKVVASFGPGGKSLSPPTRTYGDSARGGHTHSKVSSTALNRIATYSQTKERNAYVGQGKCTGLTNTWPLESNLR